MKRLAFFPILLLSLLSSFSALADFESDIVHLQTRWAEVNYQLGGKTRLTAFGQLMTEAEQVTARYPENAEGWIWSGIIESTYAGAKGGLGALKHAKAAKKDLEKAISLNGDALSGSAYTSLGILYSSVPGWPVGFGDDAKAEELLTKALSIDPDGIDSNYFYASFLLEHKRVGEAEQYLRKAQQAKPRPGRAVADAGRQKEIAEALAKWRELAAQ